MSEQHKRPSCRSAHPRFLHRVRVNRAEIREAAVAGDLRAATANVGQVTAGRAEVKGDVAVGSLAAERAVLGQVTVTHVDVDTVTIAGEVKQPSDKEVEIIGSLTETAAAIHAVVAGIISVLASANNSPLPRLSKLSLAGGPGLGGVLVWAALFGAWFLSFIAFLALYRRFRFVLPESLRGLIRLLFLAFLSINIVMISIAVLLCWM